VLPAVCVSLLTVSSSVWSTGMLPNGLDELCWTEMPSSLHHVMYRDAPLPVWSFDHDRLTGILHNLLCRMWHTKVSSCESHGDVEASCLSAMPASSPARSQPCLGMISNRLCVQSRPVTCQAAPRRSEASLLVQMTGLFLISTYHLCHTKFFPFGYSLYFPLRMIHDVRKGTSLASSEIQSRPHSLCW